jgi:hypothetical protein
MARIQYQAKVDPIVVTTVTAPPADGWLQPPSQPVRARKSAAQQSSGVAPISPWALTQPETVSIDRFAPTYPDRTRRRSLAIANHQSIALVVPEDVTVDRFAPIYPDRTLRRRLPVASQQSLAWTPITIVPTLSPDFGFMVQAVQRGLPRRGATPYQQPFVSNWPVPTPPAPLALHAFVTWVD